MIFRQYQLACLSLFSYLIGDESTGRAVMVDPQRDVSAYLDEAASLGVRIERVIETHFHADFLSGHLELAAATGAVISYGAGAQAEFPIEPLADGDKLSLGDVTLEVRSTPGHTPESISVVIREHADAAPWGVLTGDTLFIGDVGRPDLLSSIGWTSDELARRLYRSLHDKLLSLPDATRVFPGHGAGSACGKQMTDAVESTIGEQRATNYALRPMSEDAFVAAVTEGQPVAPLYFTFAADTNRRAHALLDDAETPPLLDSDGLQRCMRENTVIIDGRAPEVFASGHLRGSINVPLDGRYAEYAGDIARPGEPIVVVVEPDANTRPKSVWPASVSTASAVRSSMSNASSRNTLELGATATRLSVRDAARRVSDGTDLQIVDVRNPAEHQSGVIDGAITLPLPRLLDEHARLERDRSIIVYCASGVRSSIAASLLRAKGFTDVSDILGGYDAWHTTNPTI